MILSLYVGEYQNRFQIARERKKNPHLTWLVDQHQTENLYSVHFSWSSLLKNSEHFCLRGIHNQKIGHGINEPALDSIFFFIYLHWNSYLLSAHFFFSIFLDFVVSQLIDQAENSIKYRRVWNALKTIGEYFIFFSFKQQVCFDIFNSHYLRIFYVI